MLLQRVQQNGSSGLRLIAVDKGPGIADITRALEDGHSTAGSSWKWPGRDPAGFRYIRGLFRFRRRNADTRRILGEINPTPAAEGSLEIAAVSEPLKGEEECGDGWGSRKFADSHVSWSWMDLATACLAAEAAREAEQVLARSQVDSPQEILQDIHGALKKTRGAAVAVAKIQPEKGLLTFVGVGNIAASIVAAGSSRSMASHNGTVGHQMSRIQEFTCPWNPESHFVMHSDGLGSRWDLERYPGIWSKHPSMIATILHRDFSRRRDDVTVLVAKTL